MFDMNTKKAVGSSVPQYIVFKTRVGDASPTDGGCAIGGEWKELSSADIFSNKRVIVFALPGAFTPTCSSQQLPGFEENYEEFKSLGIDEIYCLSVNDAFVMNAWADCLGVKNVKMIPDGTGLFTADMGMFVDKHNLGFGMRSWRYSMIVNDGVIEAMFEEPNIMNNAEDDPYGESSPENVMAYLKG